MQGSGEAGRLTNRCRLAGMCRGCDGGTGIQITVVVDVNSGEKKPGRQALEESQNGGRCAHLGAAPERVQGTACEVVVPLLPRRAPVYSSPSEVGATQVRRGGAGMFRTEKGQRNGPGVDG